MHQRRLLMGAVASTRSPPTQARGEGGSGERGLAAVRHGSRELGLETGGGNRCSRPDGLHWVHGMQQFGFSNKLQMIFSRLTKLCSIQVSDFGTIHRDA